MISIGLDIGTTSISLVAYRDDHTVLDAATLPNQTFLPCTPPWERLQDPALILARATAGVQTMVQKFPEAACIGVTGQMHGILYLDAAGGPCSPLYTWQDGRGDLPMPSGGSYAAHLSARTGHPMSTGFGLTTHYYNVLNHLVPPQAVTFCTIHDYVAMVLAGLPRPLVDPSDAASLGLYRISDNAFDLSAMETAGMDPTILPDVGTGFLPGAGPLGRRVAVAIGDNQASFLGSANGDTRQALINLGTGGQFSAYTDQARQVSGLELRPFPGGGFLLVGSSLCGGKAYALLEQFFRQCAEMITGQVQAPCYDAMARMLEANEMPDNCPQVATTFNGTRQDPALCGSFLRVTSENLTPLHWTYGVMGGMVEELYQMYQAYRSVCPAPEGLVGSGNSLRKNRRLQQIAQARFDLPFAPSPNREEAACGAALYALRLMSAQA